MPNEAGHGSVLVALGNGLFLCSPLPSPPLTRQALCRFYIKILPKKESTEESNPFRCVLIPAQYRDFLSLS